MGPFPKCVAWLFQTFWLGYIDFDRKINKPTGGVSLYNFERARFPPSLKFINWITIGSSLELDRQLRNDHHKIIGVFGTPATVFDFLQ